MYFLKLKIWEIIFIGLVILINLPLIFNTYALTDGWWETYAWMVSVGQKPYQDFYLAFPPLFVILQEQVLKIFGDYLINVRWIGLTSIVFQLFILYKFLRFFSGSTSALLGMAISYGFIYQNGNYLVSDYHNYVSIFGGLILIGIIGFTRTIDNRRYLLLSLAGLSCGLLFLTKQNNAVFLTIASISVLVFHSYVKNKIIKLKLLVELLFFLLLISIPLVIAFFVFDLLWYHPYFSNDSKGSLSTVFLRFVLDESIRKQLIFSIGLGLLGVYAYRFLKDKHFKGQSLESFPVGLILIVYFGIFYLKGAVAISMFAITWIIFRRVIQRTSSEYFEILVLMGALVYCGTQSAGLNIVSLEYLIAITFAELFELFIKKIGFPNYLKTFPHLVLLIITLPKITNNIGYEWWGYQAGKTITRENILHNFDYFKGISTDKVTKNIIDDLYLIKKEINNKDKILAFPSIPIVYKLLDKPPEFPPVLWFDVVSDQQVNGTILALNDSLPDYIFWLRPPWFVYEGHFALKQKFPSQLLVDNYISNETHLNNYYVKSARILGVKKFLTTIDYRNCSESTKAMLMNSCREDASCKITNNEIGYYFNKPLENIKLPNELCFSSNQPIFYILKIGNTNRRRANGN